MTFCTSANIHLLYNKLITNMEGPTVYILLIINIIIIFFLFAAQYFITKILRPDFVNFIFSIIFFFLGISFVDNAHTNSTTLSVMYKFLVIVIPIIYLSISISSIRLFKHDLIEYRKQFTIHIFMLLFTIIPFISVFHPLSLYIFLLYQVIFVISFLFSECIWFIPKDYKFEFKKREVKRLREIFKNNNLLIMNFLLDNLKYEFRIIRKVFYRIKFNFTLLFMTMFIFAFLPDRDLITISEQYHPLALFLLIGIQFFLFMRLLYNGLLAIVLSCFLITVKTLVFIGEFILAYPIALFIGGLITARIWYVYGYPAPLAIISITISSIYVYYLYNIHKSRYLASSNFIRDAIRRFLGKYLTLNKEEKNKTYYLTMTMITLLWFFTLKLVLSLLPIPPHLVNISLHPVFIVLSYFTFRFLFLILKAEFWYLFIVFSSPFFLFFLNSYALYRYNLALNNTHLAPYLNSIEVSAVLSLVELLIFIIFIIRTANIETIDSIKRALLLFFIAATVLITALKFIPNLFIYSTPSSVNLTPKDIDEINKYFSVFKSISEWSFIPSVIGSVVGTIYIDLKKKELEEQEQKKERRLLRALVSKSYPIYKLK